MLVYVNPPWSQDYIGETNATNNIVNVSVTLGQRLPDLTLLNVSWLPADPYVGQTLIVTAEVYNAGNGASPAADVSLFLDYNITALVTVQAPELAAGANGSVTLSWNTSGVSAGNHRLRAAVDPEYHIVESSKANNTFTWTLEFAGVLDLALLNLTVSPASPRPGDNVKFAVTVVNLGTLRCNSANLTLRVGGSVADHLQLLALAAGGVLNASLEWSTAGLVAGTYDCELSVAAGPGDNDTDGSNNMLGRTVQLLPPEPRPDLRIRSIVLSEQVVRTGDPLTLTVVIENAGNLDANASAINILLESSAGRLFRFTDSPMAVPGIAAGQAVTINISGDTSRFSPDNYTLDAAADYGSDVAESNESNNHFVMALGILAPLPKLPSVNVDDILIAGRLEEGQKVDLIAVVNNSGDGPAMDLLITFIVDGSVAGTQNLDQLAAHAIRNATLAWTFSPGSHTVRATVSAPGVAEVASQRSVTIQATASQYTSYLVAAALGVVLILLAAVMARGYTKSRSPGPRVKLVEEEE
jgi:subtilase family serine protease